MLKQFNEWKSSIVPLENSIKLSQYILRNFPCLKKNRHSDSYTLIVDRFGVKFNFKLIKFHQKRSFYRRGTISFIIIVQMTFHWKGRTMTGHSIGGTMVIPRPGFAWRLTKYWSVSSAGRLDGIDFQTNVDWISTKMNDAQQVPRRYLHAPAGITCYLHLCIRPVRSLLQPWFSPGTCAFSRNFSLLFSVRVTACASQINQDINYVLYLLWIGSNTFVV